MKHYFAALHRIFHRAPVPDIVVSKFNPLGQLTQMACAVKIVEYYDMARVRSSELLNQVPSDKASPAGD
jgi:hypothetical protein